MEKILVQLTGAIPFILMAEGSGRIKINMARIVEGLIIAAIAGVMAGYIATREIKIELMNVKATISETNRRICQIDDRLWQHQTATEGRR